MYLLQNRVIAAVGYPYPAIATPITLAVQPNLAVLAGRIGIGLGVYGTNYTYSNGTSAYTLLKNIDSEQKKIDTYESTINNKIAAQGNSYKTTAQYRSYQNLIEQCNSRIDNYKRQLTRLAVTQQIQRTTVYVSPYVAPYNPYYNPYNYPSYSPYRNPYYDQWGRAMYDGAGRPYFDQWGNPYSWTPYYYYNGSYGGNKYNWSTGTYYWG